VPFVASTNLMPSYNKQVDITMKHSNHKTMRFASALLAMLIGGTTSTTPALAQSIPSGYGYTPPPANGPASGYAVPSPYGTLPPYGAQPSPVYTNPPAVNNQYAAQPGYGNAIPQNVPMQGYPTSPSANNAPIDGSVTVGQPMFGQPIPGPVIVAQPTLVPPNSQALPFPGPMNQPLPPLNQPWQIEPNTVFTSPTPFGYNPKIRDVPVEVIAQEGQTGRFSVGGSVNSDLGVAGQIIMEERNFDIMRWPGRPSDLLNGAFRGAGQNFRVELVPGNNVQRYTLNWTEPNLFGYSPFSLSVGGFYFTRMYRDWTEQRLGGRVAVGYEVTPDLSLTTELRAEDVKISNPRVAGLPALDRVIGSNDLYTGRVRLAHNTRDSPFLPTEGHLLEMIYDQTFGEFDFPRAQINYSKYFLVRERADGTGRHTFTNAVRLGFTGEDTPLFENFFAGGFSTMRGFQFRGAGPVESDVQVGGRFQFLGTLEYMMPITADDMLRMVAFVDYGTVEKDIEINWDNFRVAPGFGARIAVPALGPAPLAFDFAFPVAYAENDSRQVFSFTMGLTR
jgi:outer membrane protein insertion porin family